MSNRRDIQFTFNPHNKATVLDCSFTVDSTAGDGLTNLNKSGRIANVYMHSSAAASDNPNPESGIILVQLQDNYNRFLSNYSSIASPNSGSSISISTGSSLTVGHVYVITALGSTTQTQWEAVGLSPFIKAAVGVVFVASATSGSGTGTVQAPATAGSGVDHLEVIGDPNLQNNSLAGAILGAGIGMQIMLGCYSKAFTYNSGTPANSTVTNALAAPADGSVIRLAFYLNNSAQGV